VAADRRGLAEFRRLLKMDDAIPSFNVGGVDQSQRRAYHMEPLHLAHLIVLGMWLGVVITEVLFEFTASDAESLRAAARFHYTVDKYGELPILIAVLVTGAILAVRAWPLTPLHFIKIGASLVAVGSALVCVMWVFQRRRIEDVNALLRFRRRIWTLAAVAAVFAAPALYLGLVYFRE
jgi:hypothetical protein